MSPSTTLTIARHEYMTTLRRRSVQFVIFGLPLIFVVVTSLVSAVIGQQGAQAGLAFAQDLVERTVASQDQPVGVVDATGALTPALLEAVNRNRRAPLVAFADEETALAAVERGEARGFYRVPANYVETGEVAYVGEDRSPIDATEGGLYRALIASALLDQADPEAAVQIANRAANPVGNVNETDLAESSTASDGGAGGGAGGLAFGLGFAVAGLFFMTVISSASYLLQSLGVEKQNRVMEVLLSSVRPMELLVGKMIGLGAVGLTQIAVWGIFALPVILLGLVGAAYGIAVGAVDISLLTIVLTILHFICGYLVYASLFAALGAVAPNPKESSQYTFFFLLPTFLPLWFGWLFLEQPNAAFATTLSLVPFTAPIAMPMRLMVTNVPLWQPLLGLSLALITALLTLWLATRVFRGSGALLSSQGFSWGRLWSAVR